MFKVGDRVRCLNKVDGNNFIVGQSGTIRLCYAGGYTVEFDKMINGHNDACFGKINHCWNCPGYSLVFLDKKVIKPYGIVQFMKGV